MENRVTPAEDGIAIVVLTHNRVHLLRKCVENVLLRTSDATREIVIWDNGSTDGTAEYLQTITDPRFKVIHSETNVGFNGYARGFRETDSFYMVELDDDIVDAPHGWDRMLRDAYIALPEIGFLAADLENDPHDEASRYRHVIRAHEYTLVEENGVRLLAGPAGGGCAMTSRDVNALAGGFIERPGEVFWLEDGDYISAIEKVGYRASVLADLRVHHTGGAYYANSTPEKDAYWAKYWAMRRRRELAKAMLVKIPGVRRLNDRFGWFVAPAR
jgi:GT2 family glycosyltransferase